MATRGQSQIGGAPAGTAGDVIPAGRYAIDLEDRYDDTWRAWLVENRGKVRVASTEPSPPMTAYVFTLAAPAKWPVALAWPTLLGAGQAPPDVTPTADLDYPPVPGTDLANELESALLHAPAQAVKLLTVGAVGLGVYVVFRLLRK